MGKPSNAAKVAFRKDWHTQDQVHAVKRQRRLEMFLNNLDTSSRYATEHSPYNDDLPAEIAASVKELYE